MSSNRHQLEVVELDRRHRRIIRMLSFVGAGVLVVAALWSAGLPPTQWWAQMQAWLAQPDKPTVEAAASTPPRVTPSAESTAAAIPSSEAPSGTDSSVSIAPQPLFLVATSPGRNKNEGTAQIGTNPDNPQTYVGGAILANGARLTEIHRDHVILARGDSSARLELFRRNVPAAPTSNALLLVGGEQPGQVPIKPTQEIITQYLRPSPVYDGETLRGYQVYAGPKAGVFSRLGLEPGDVITAIDDAPLNDPQQSMELFAQLPRGSAVVATIERKGGTRRITLDGAHINADQEQAATATAQAAPPMAMPQT
jgi:hypothetical protein